MSLAVRVGTLGRAPLRYRSPWSLFPLRRLPCVADLPPTARVMVLPAATALPELGCCGEASLRWAMISRLGPAGARASRNVFAAGGESGGAG